MQGSYFLRREERSKEASTPSKASPYMGRMQPLLLVALNRVGTSPTLHCKFGPSKVRLDCFSLPLGEGWGGALQSCRPYDGASIP